MVIQQTTADAMEFIIQRLSDGNGPDIITICLFTTKGEHTFVSIGHQFPAFFSRDPSGAAKSSHGIDEQVLHALASQKTISGADVGIGPYIREDGHVSGKGQEKRHGADGVRNKRAVLSVFC